MSECMQIFHSFQYWVWRLDARAPINRCCSTGDYGGHRRTECKTLLMSTTVCAYLCLGLCNHVGSVCLCACLYCYMSVHVFECACVLFVVWTVFSYFNIYILAIVISVSAAIYEYHLPIARNRVNFFCSIPFLVQSGASKRHHSPYCSPAPNFLPKKLAWTCPYGLHWWCDYPDTSNTLLWWCHLPH